MSKFEDFRKSIQRVSNRIDKMILLCENLEFQQDLKSLQYDLMYCSPEMIGHWDRQMDQCLRKYISTPLTGWQKKVIEAYISP